MSIQIKKKFIKSQVIDGTKVLFLNEDAFKASKADGSEVSLFKVNSDNEFRFLEMPKVSSDPAHGDDLTRASYVDAEISGLQTQIDALENGVQDELDATQVGAGLEESGAYVAPLVSNYLAAATSLKDADSKLDTQAKVIADGLAQEILDRAADVDAEEARAIAAEGVIAGDLAQEILDRAADVDAEEARAIAAEAAITAAYEAEDLTLVKLDGSRDILGTFDFYDPSNTSGLNQHIVLRQNLDGSQAMAVNFGEIISGTWSNDGAPENAAGLGSPVTIGFRLNGVDGLQINSGTKEVYARSTGFEIADSGSQDSAKLDPFSLFIKSALSDTSTLITNDSGDYYTGFQKGTVIECLEVNDPSILGEFSVASKKAVLGANDGVEFGTVDTNTYVYSEYGSVVKDGADMKIEAAGDLKLDSASEIKVLKTIDMSESGIYNASGLDLAVSAVEYGYLMKEVDGFQVESTSNLLLKAEASSQIKAMSELSMESAKIVNVADPSSDQDAATKIYVDTKVADLVDSAPAVLDTLNELAAALGDDPNFATTVAGQIGDVAADLAQEILDRAADVDAEEARAIAAEAAIQSELDATQVGAGLGTDGSYTAPAVSNYLGSAISLKDADSKLDTEIKSVADDLAQEVLDRVADVDAEEARALAAEGLLDGRLDVLEGDATTEGSVAKAEQDAKDYTDAREAAITTAYEAYTDAAIAQEVLDRNNAISTAVSNLVDGAPALLDTLNELAAAINDDENFAATVATQISGLDSRADALEAASIEFKAVEKFVLNSTDISNGYITLSYKAIQNSLRVSVDRLAIHQGAGNDYTVSEVGGVTRITFVNSLVTAGQEQLSVNDEVYVEGAKLAIVTV